MTVKNFVFKISGKIVEIVDWDITIDEMESLKQNVAIVNGVAPGDIAVDTVEIEKPIVSETAFVTPSGLQFKAPNPYSMMRPVNGLTFSMEIETRRGNNGIEKITENGSNYLIEKIVAGRADDVIIFS